MVCTQNFKTFEVLCILSFFKEKKLLYIPKSYKYKVKKHINHSLLQNIENNNCERYKVND